MKKRLILAILLMPVLVVLVGYIAWPIWAPTLIRAVLANHEVHLLKADIARPGWRSLKIVDLAVSYRSADHVATLNSAEIKLTYSWSQLLQGRLETLYMPVASLQLVTAPQQEPVSAEPLSLSLIFPDTVFAQLPLTQLDVDAFELTLPDDAVYQTLTGSLHVTSEQLRLQLASSQTSSVALPDLLLILKADRQNRLQLNLRQGHDELLTIQSQIDNSLKPAQQSPQLLGDLSLDLQAGSELLKQLGLLDSGYQLAGKTQLHWQTSLPEIIDEDIWQRQLITAALSSEGSFVSPQYSGQAQFDIKAHFQVKDAAATVSFPIFKVDGTVDLGSELSAWLDSETVSALPLHITLAPDTQLHANLESATVRMEEGAAELRLGRLNTPLLAQLQLQTLSLQAEKEWRAQARFKTQLALDEIKNPQLSARALAFTGAGQASLGAETIRLQFEAGSSLQGKKIKLQEGQIDALNINIPRAFEVALQDQKLVVPELELQVAGTQLRWQDQSGQFAAASLQLKELLLDLENSSQVSAQIDSQVTGLQAATGDLQLKPLALQGNWLFSENVLSGTLALNDRSGVMTVNGQLKHNLDSGRGTFNSQLQTLKFRQSEIYLPKLFMSWTYPFDLFAGQLEMSSTLSWDTSQEEVMARLQGRVQLNDVGGFYESNLFYGLNTELTVDAPLADLKVVAKQFTIDSLDAGIPVKNVTFSLQSTLDKLQVNDFQAELLGGLVSQKNAIYDLNLDENELLLQLHNIQLSEVLALETGIEGVGVLDGQLPIKITTDGFTMALGRVQARSPGGIIKYQGGQALSSAAANVGVAFAIDALHNFHYEVLDIKVDYAEDGQLQLETTLLGRNPDLAEQRPVRFNINIQENIPALIKSLKLSQNIGDDIERRLKALMNKKTGN